MIKKLRNQPYAPKWEQEEEKNVAVNVVLLFVPRSLPGNGFIRHNIKFRVILV
jgi:hypothetical protein